LKELTSRQQQIFDFVEQHLQATGMPPTRVEIAAELGFRSPNAAEDHLKALAKKGVIELVPGASRGIRIIDAEPEGLPIVGSVAAGSPVLAVENIDEHLKVGANLFSQPAHYLLRVKGLSMREAGILEGDLIAVNRELAPRNGDTVVARIDDDVTVKRLQKNGKIVELHPENPDFDVIQVDPERHDFAIEGVVVGLLRI